MCGLLLPKFGCLESKHLVHENSSCSQNNQSPSIAHWPFVDREEHRIVQSGRRKFGAGCLGAPKRAPLASDPDLTCLQNSSSDTMETSEERVWSAVCTL